MQSTLRASGRPCPLHLRPATRRPLRLVCALSLDRPASNSGRLLSQPKTAERSTTVVTPATASATAAVIDIGAPLQDEATYEAGYDSGYQAGLEAARKAALEGGAAPQVAPAHDSLLRSMVKALSWRFFSTATTIFLAMAFFDASLESALEMGAAEFVSKYLLYLIHERGWIYIKLN